AAPMFSPPHRQKPPVGVETSAAILAPVWRECKKKSTSDMVFGYRQCYCQHTLGRNGGVPGICLCLDTDRYEQEEKPWNSRRHVRFCSAITAVSSPHTGLTAPCTPASSSAGRIRAMRRSSLSAAHR